MLFIYLFHDRAINAVSNFDQESYQEILFILFILLAGVLTVLAFTRNYSLIPLLGVSCCMYLMVEIPAKSWIVFFGWMLLGLLIYFFYGRRKSKLAAS
jgi:hypothetical protein